MSFLKSLLSPIILCQKNHMMRLRAIQQTNKHNNKKNNNQTNNSVKVPRKYDKTWDIEALCKFTFMKQAFMLQQNRRWHWKKIHCNNSTLIRLGKSKSLKTKDKTKGALRIRLRNELSKILLSISNINICTAVLHQKQTGNAHKQRQRHKKGKNTHVLLTSYGYCYHLISHLSQPRTSPWLISKPQNYIYIILISQSNSEHGVHPICRTLITSIWDFLGRLIKLYQKCGYILRYKNFTLIAS